MTLYEFQQSCIRYRSWSHGSVTSAGRTETRNAAVGGVRLSAHMFNLAEDVVYDDPAEHPLAQRIEAAKRLGLRLIHEGDHDHLQPLDWPAG